jgi:hypothetical protein
MLKISKIDTPGEHVLVVEGALVDPWLEVLKTAWEVAYESDRGGRFVINLEGVTTIAPQGESILLQMMDQGAQFFCSGVFTRHVLDQLEARRTADPAGNHAGQLRSTP